MTPEEIKTLEQVERLESESGAVIFRNVLATCALSLLKESLKYPEGNDHGYFEEKIGAMRGKLKDLKAYRKDQDRQIRQRAKGY